MLPTRYGHFSDDGKAFRITDPKTPMPWVNVISNGRFGLTISQNGGGFSFFDDAQHCVISRWEMDLVRDSSGKFLYLADLDSGQIWSVAPTPCRTQHDSYECTHTLGSTTFRTAFSGIETVWTLAASPADGSPGGAEVWTVEIRNLSGRPRRLRIASYFEWCCGVAPDTKREFHRLFITTTHDEKRRAIVATKNMWDIPPKTEREHWNQPWPYAAAHAIVPGTGLTFTRSIAIADKEMFIGKYGGTDKPVALTGSARPHTGGFGRFTDQVAALGGDFALDSGGSAKLAYLITIGRDVNEALALVDRWSKPGAAETVAADALAMWDTLLGPTTVETADQSFDLLNNTWLRYQAISARLWARTGYYQQSGAFGFRDQLQDTHVWLPLEPGRCLDHIKLAATRQFEDGSVNHWWHALADFGNHTACSDDYLWLPFVVAGYLKETGDFSALNTPIPFRAGGFRKPAPTGHVPADGSLLEHCRRSFDRAFSRFSPRGLPHIGSCDWNDGLSAVGIQEKGESVWLALFLCQLLDDWDHVFEQVGERETSEDYRRRRAALAKSINDHAWDGPSDSEGHYRCATKDNGDWIGASSSPEGKIHLNPQTWAIIANVAPQARADAAWRSVKEKLLTPYGPLLLAPAYTVPDTDIGYITRYSPGSRENGGVYMHAATWALLAACKRREPEVAGRIFKSIAPPTRAADANAYYAEPYVLPGNVDGPLSETPGRAGWTWYSGSASWLNKVSLEWVMGLRATWRGLLIDPCPYRELGQVTVERLFRGVRVRVSFDAAEFVSGAPAEVSMKTTDGWRILKDGIVDAALASAVAAGDAAGADAKGAVLELSCTWNAGEHKPGATAIPAQKEATR